MTKQAEAQKRWRGRNKETIKSYRKEYLKRPEVRERLRVSALEWRRNNPEKQKEISKKTRDKHAGRVNKLRRIKYHTDPQYKKRIIDCEKRYKATGRRKELRVINAVKLRKIVSAWKKKNTEWTAKYVRKYKDRYWLKHQQEQRDSLDDRYVICVIKKDFGYKIKTAQIPKELIEIKRVQILTKRLLKKQKL